MLLDDDLQLLGPYATTPPRIADEVVDALARVPGVAVIALAGSLAARTHDGFSDIDVLVASEDGPSVTAASVAAIEEAKPVRYYRPFSAPGQPAGRYWFEGESPFHHLDLSFHAAREYEWAIRAGVKEPQAIRAVEVWRGAHGSATGMREPRLAGGLHPARTPVAIAAEEWERYGRFADFLGQARLYLRGQSGRAAFDGAWAEFLERTRGVRFDARTPAGRLGEMIQDCWRVRAAIDRAERGG